MIALLLLCACDPAERLEDAPGYRWTTSSAGCRTPSIRMRGDGVPDVIYRMGEVCVRSAGSAASAIEESPETWLHACGHLVIAVSVPASLPVLAERQWRREDELARLVERSIAAVCP